MNVAVNGTPREVDDGATVAQLLQQMELGADARGVAVACNGDVVVRSQWDSTALLEGDSVEILHAVQGG